jgi:3-oxoacyl-[acyl-carrier-protein] synthase II
MMNHDRFAQTLNLENLDSSCAELDYIVDSPRQISTDYVMSNNFAFGGINTSLIFRRWR